MKIVGLISGGKDSIFSLMECKAFGHEICALANLCPEDPMADEIDSYTFQTVGHNVLDCVAKAMRVPLVKHTTKGMSNHQGLYYSPTENDEVEDLYQLLLKVKQLFPDIMGVSSGAILSTYQRSRIENVCSRLGLTSFAFCWRRKQKELVRSMLDSGMEIILIKTASMGLYPRKVLGKKLLDLFDLLVALEADGINIAGEGGEYESLVLDCDLFYERIVIDRYELVGKMLDNQYAPNGHMHISQFHLELKTCVKDCSYPSLPFGASWVRPANLLPPLDLPISWLPSYSKNGPFVSVSSFGLNWKKENQSVQEEAFLIMDFLKFQLSLAGCELKDVIFVHLYLRDLDDYATLNAVYSLYFKSNPPSRVCIAVGKSSFHFLALGPQLHSTIISTAGVKPVALACQKHSVLHVQSISRWAPANIGPYSQAVHFEGLLFLAGQIGIDPPTMNLVSEENQLQQALTNCESVLNAVYSDLDHVIDCLLYTSRKFGEDLPILNASFDYIILGTTNLPRSACFELEFFAYQPRILKAFCLEKFSRDDNFLLLKAKFVKNSFALALMLGEGPDMSNIANEAAKYLTDFLEEYAMLSLSNLVNFTIFIKHSLYENAVQAFNEYLPNVPLHFVPVSFISYSRKYFSIASRIVFLDFHRHQSELWIRSVNNAPQI